MHDRRVVASEVRADFCGGCAGHLAGQVDGELSRNGDVAASAVGKDVGFRDVEVFCDFVHDALGGDAVELHQAGIGGGHAKAAGCTLTATDIAEAMHRIVSSIHFE